MSARDARAADPLFRPAVEALISFFNSHHDKLLCTASKDGEPSVSIMGTPRLLDDGILKFEISDPLSLTLKHTSENRSISLVAYLPGPRARDYRGVRIYARMDEILTEGDEVEALR